MQTIFIQAAQVISVKSYLACYVLISLRTSSHRMAGGWGGKYGSGSILRRVLKIRITIFMMNNSKFA